MKITRKTNIRVEVEPVSMYWRGRTDESVENAALQTCESIIADIKKHVDDVASATIQYDMEHTCSHCGSNWEVSEDDSDPEWPKGMPLCCFAAIEEFKASKQ